MKLFHKLIIILNVSLIFLALKLPAQSYNSFQSEIKQIYQQAKWRLGPFRIYPMIRFKDIGYDDNVYRKREEDNPISDYTATISPQLKIYLLFRNWIIFSFIENPEYVYFFKEKRERSFNNSYSPALKFLIFHRFVLSGNYQYQRRRRRATSEFDVRAYETIKGYNGSFFYETAHGTSFGFSGAQKRINYEDINLPGQEIYLSRILNRKEKNVSFEFYYRIFSNSHFFISSSYTKYQFEHRQFSWRDSFSYQGYAGIRFPLLGRIRGTFSLGYKKLIPKAKGRKSFSGLVGNTGLNFKLGRFIFRIQYNRDCKFSYWTDNIFYVEDRYGTGISVYATNFLRLDYNFGYGEGHYPDFVLIRLPADHYQKIKRFDIYRTHNAAFVFRLIRNIGIGLGINYWQRDSNVYWVKRSNWFLGGYVTYEF